MGWMRAGLEKDLDVIAEASRAPMGEVGGTAETQGTRMKDRMTTNSFILATFSIQFPSRGLVLMDINERIRVFNQK